jgi:hypothetical protein
MFVQHAVSSTPQLTKANNINADFDLKIKSKTNLGIQGKISFQYLHQPFEASISLSPTSIQLNSLYPFVGLTVSAPVLQQEVSNETVYFFNGTLTKTGSQNIVWLILDVIHLYNLLRLKPAAILESYREAVAFAKTMDEQMQFGNIPLSGSISKSVANFLSNKMKLKHKYIFSNSIQLLSNVQVILATYPQQFLLPKAMLPNLKPAIS